MAAVEYHCTSQARGPMSNHPIQASAKACMLLLIVPIFLISYEAAAEQGRIYGVGANSCGQWTESRRTNDVAARLSQTNWLGGSLSALNIWLPRARLPPTNGNLAGATDMNGLMAWMDEYCRTHPLDAGADATAALVHELLERIRK